MLEREATGGQAGTSSRIENYLGFPTGIAGGDLASAPPPKRNGSAQRSSRQSRQTASGSRTTSRSSTAPTAPSLRCHAILVATGMTVRKLPLAGYEKYEGAGVYYGAARARPPATKAARVFIVGGANSAGQAAMMFSRHAAKVTVVVRGETLEEGMSQYLVDQITGRENIECC